MWCHWVGMKPDVTKVFYWILVSVSARVGASQWYHFLHSSGTACTLLPRGDCKYWTNNVLHGFSGPFHIYHKPALICKKHSTWPPDVTVSPAVFAFRSSAELDSFCPSLMYPTIVELSEYFSSMIQSCTESQRCTYKVKRNGGNVLSVQPVCNKWNGGNV